MTGHLGFSYTGLIFLLLLFIPNIIWTGKKPQGYSAEKESIILLFFERTGEVLTCCCALVFRILTYINGQSGPGGWLLRLL